MPSHSLVPMCFGCARLVGVVPGLGWSCAAFDRIPTEILASAHDHREPFEGDRGLTFEPKSGDSVPTPIATDPPVSENQRKAMWAAASGHSTLGIPSGVGREFAGADPGGKLPKSAGDMKPEEFGLLRKLLNKFFGEEAKEPEHAEDDRTWDRKGRAASVAFTTDDGRVLLLRRSAKDEHRPGEWCLPGGKAEDGEDFEAAARREAVEEAGDCTFDGMCEIERTRTAHDWEHATFGVPVKDEFTPKLSDEHDDFRWAPITELPENTHPGVQRAFDGVQKAYDGIILDGFEEGKHPRDGGGKFSTAPTTRGWYHGGREDFDADKSDVVYMTPDRDQASHYASGAHAGGYGFGDPRISEMVSTGGDVADIDGAITDAIENGSFDDQVLLDAFEAAKVNGARYVEYSHPDASGEGSHRVRVSLYPKDDVKPIRSLNLKTRKTTTFPEYRKLSTLPHASPPIGVQESYDGITLDESPDQDREVVGKQALDSEPDWADLVASALAGGWEDRPTLAYDRDSIRRTDDDGRLHVDVANICQAKVDEYYGREINGVMDGEPGWVPLEADRKYRLLRDPDELAKPETVKSANGIPILSTHLPTSAADHKFRETVGSTGSTASYDHPFVKNALSFWPQAAIDDVDDGTKAQLSPGYKYRADMTPGEFEGEPFDGRMTDIRFNHLAQVPRGRQGSRVVVPDADPDWDRWVGIATALRDAA